MNLAILVEERSMKAFLEGLLPRILPDTTSFQIVAHEGKSDLDLSIPRKLRAWRTPDTRFVIVRDQDGEDCRAVKDRIATLCADAGRGDTLVRIACRELEAWFFGDLVALSAALSELPISAIGKKKLYRDRDPDGICKPSGELARIVPSYGKVKVARAMGCRIDLARCTSESFRQFHTGILKFASRCQSESVPSS